jgi:hypothetical protein
MLAQMAQRNIAAPWSVGIPEERPERFFTIEQLNTRTEWIFADSVLLQIGVYDLDGKRAETTASLVKGLWLVMPNELNAQDVEHAGGPSYQKDPRVPHLNRLLVTAWVTVMNTLA